MCFVGFLIYSFIEKHLEDAFVVSVYYYGDKKVTVKISLRRDRGKKNNKNQVNKHNYLN